MEYYKNDVQIYGSDSDISPYYNSHYTIIE